VVKLPQAKNATEVFSLFAEHVALLFGGLLHIRCTPHAFYSAIPPSLPGWLLTGASRSILLLPKDSSGASANTGTGSTGGQAKAHKGAGRGKDNAAGKGQASAKSNKATEVPESTAKHRESRAWEQMGSDTGFRALDWSNCCIFHVFKGRGPVVQSPPPWPLACTASYHAGVVDAEVLTTADYSQQCAARHSRHARDRGPEKLCTLHQFA
jgi:hypothetical protein